ncbi:MATE family transporter [Weissella oryzae SG25]|uniref:MATE family transporter n=1 Tax=Weissella oryzae (strain DSM 25784 / JCM 18191 / LMG 30913 / SG25) TaxID=1329250 RepID=A0A069CUJ9_WEIOS|nr:MATE family transporter [Weissella oryzae SG25]
MRVNDLYSLVSMYGLLFMAIGFIIYWVVESELFSKEQSYEAS